MDPVIYVGKFNKKSKPKTLDLKLMVFFQKYFKDDRKKYTLKMIQKKLLW